VRSRWRKDLATTGDGVTMRAAPPETPWFAPEAVRGGWLVCWGNRAVAFLPKAVIEEAAKRGDVPDLEITGATPRP
jgi:hypothetical protein